MAEETKPAATLVIPDDRSVQYTPLAERDPIVLTIASVMNNVAIHTKKGYKPTVADVVKFMMLCKSRALNPFVGDAYLIGYDSERDGPTFQLITAIQALRKRAELNPQYEGCERGVIVTRGDDMIERVGTMTLKGETLVGGWAKAYRQGYRVPFYETVKLSTYSTGRSRWAKDPEGMIVKCAEAASLRRGFPSDVGGLYVAEEFDSAERTTVKSNISERLADLTKRPEPGTERRETVVETAKASQDDADEPDTSAEPESDADPECAAEPSKKGDQAFAELKDMLSKAMRAEDVEAVRQIILGKKSILTQAQWNQLAMADSDQLSLIADAEEADKAGR